MIRFSNVSLIRGTKVLLEGADAVLNPGDRIGLIGANGSGKSSLFAVLRGELHTDKGEADFPPQWRVAHVAQETPALERAAVEYAIDGDTNLRILEKFRLFATSVHLFHDPQLPQTSPLSRPVKTSLLSISWQPVGR